MIDADRGQGFVVLYASRGYFGFVSRHSWPDVWLGTWVAQNGAAATAGEKNG